METILVMTIVSVAALYAGRRAWKSMRAARKAKAGCGSDCGCE